MLVHHALHGYHEGHGLLSASINLTDRAWRSSGQPWPEWNRDLCRTLDCKSDLTGYLPGEAPRSFTYETGYPVGNIFVFARTWYDEECHRSGAVLTHSLLIPRSYIERGDIPDIYGLEHHFRRPPLRTVSDSRGQMTWGPDDLSFYREQIEIDPQLIPAPALPSTYEVAVNTSDPILICPPDGVRDVIRYLWRAYGPGSQAGWAGAANLTFCTFSLNPSRVHQQMMKVQGVPQYSYGAFYGHHHLIQGLYLRKRLK